MNKKAIVAGTILEALLLADPGVARVIITTVNEQVLDYHVSGLAGEGVGILQQNSDENDQEDLQDRVILDDAERAKPLTPDVIEFAEEATKHATYNSEKDKGQIMDGTIGSAVVGLEEHELSRTIWVQCPEHHGSAERT